MLGLRLVHCQNSLRVVQKYAKCDECGAPMEVREDLACRKGLVTKMFFFCTSCMKEDLFCNPYSNEDVKSVNAKSVLAARMAGMGRDGLSCFLGVMGLPQPVTPRAFSSHNQRLWELSNSEAEKSLHQAAANLHHAAGADPEDVIDETVTLDGTWSKRGFTAKYGMVAALSHNIGQVLDVEVLSKSCSECEKRTSMDHFSDEYWAEHEPRCNRNYYSSSSPMMEVEGALIIFRRSQSKHKLRYTKVLIIVLYAIHFFFN